MFELSLHLLHNLALVIGCFALAIIAVCIFGFTFLGLASRMDDKAQLYSNQIGKPNDETKGETKA
jgi:hypothetical protein